METKVYDYKEDRVRTLLVDAFKRRKREATLADLVADTAIPRPQVEEQLPAVAEEFGARLRVTESGELLYSFPRGFKSNKRGFRVATKRFLKSAGKGIRAALTWLFKTWIVVMLVGYFVVFLALLLLFIVGGTAASASGKGNSRRSSSGGANLAGSLIQLFIRIWFYSEFFKDPQQRSWEARSRKTKRPLHKAIFSFVFGDGDPNADWPTLERKALLSFLRSKKGIITLSEFMALSGRNAEDAQNALNAYCLEFEGSPEASEEGVLYWRFSSILKSADGAASAFASSPLPAEKREEAFSSNPRKANVWFAVINGVNFLFGSLFLYGGAAWADFARAIVSSGTGKIPAGTGFLTSFYIFVYHFFESILGINDPAAFISWILGVVPIAFAAFFYLIPFLRNLGRKKRNALIARDNSRRRTWAGILAEPMGVRAVAPGVDASLLEEAAAAESAEVESDDSGAFRYSFPSVKRAKQAAFRLRSEESPDASSVGKAIFDTEGDTI